ncbi:hypothetical protein GQ457_01G024310 [Hibiscus cannabinus]
MSEKFGFLICVWVMLVGNCLGKFVVEKCSLKVTSPGSAKGVYDCAMGNFGIPQYGGTLVGTVVYPDANRGACQPFYDDTSFKSKSGGFPTFVLVNRGDCYFALKAWNAQKAGAAAILVDDNQGEPLITMDGPEEEKARAEFLQNITIPTAFISMSLGDSLKAALKDLKMVKISLDWTESLPHPDDRVEYEFWTNSNDECGPKCDSQLEFVKDFKGVAQELEQKGYTQFIPHYITWFCPDTFLLSEQCKSQCINNGRYCVPDPDQDFNEGYTGKDVVVENLRQACLFKVANASGKPWLWWDYVTQFSVHCPMNEKKYNKECAAQVIQYLGVDEAEIDKCIGDPEADVENPVLKAEQDAQASSRGDVTILPTLVINNRQFRGKLDKRAVLKAICAGFQETTEPAICLTEDIQTNECLENNGGCWHDKTANITACRDTFRGRVCECPVVNERKLLGLYIVQSTMEDVGVKHEEERHTLLVWIIIGLLNASAHLDSRVMQSTAVKMSMSARRNWLANVGDANAKIPGAVMTAAVVVIHFTFKRMTCASVSHTVETASGWGTFWSIILGLIIAGAVGYAIYKYRIRRYMDTEVRAIMAQYMPLDNQPDNNVHHPDI